MDYVLRVTLTPFLGRTLVDDPSGLVNSLEEISSRVISGNVQVGTRKAEVRVAAETHEALTLLTVPWCIATGEHPPAEAILADIHKQDRMGIFGDIGGDLAKRKDDAGTAPRYEVRFAARHLPVGAAKTVQQMQESLRGLKGRVRPSTPN